MLVPVASQDWQKKPRSRGVFFESIAAGPRPGCTDSPYFFFASRWDRRSAADMKLSIRSSAIDHHCT